LRRVISEEEALEGARALTRVIELVERERLGGKDVEGVMALALSLSLTFYDASYLYLAKSRGGVLVTEDGGLRERARAAGVRAIGVEEYLAERERDRTRER
jgi:predicted nucleic acid-binding protein